MKLVVVIVQDYDTDRLLRAVTDAGFSATRIASTGGFLRTGNVTVMIGADDDQVGRLIATIGVASMQRTVTAPSEISPDLTDIVQAGVADVTIGGSVVFVLNVARFERIEDASAALSR